MKITTVGRKVNLRQSFIDHAEKRMQKFDKFFGDDAAAAATVAATVEKDRRTVEITLRSRGIIYRSESTDSSLDAAFNDAADQLSKQIIRHKEKLGDRIKKEQAEAALTEERQDYSVVREKTFVVEKMTVDEAALQMDLLSHSFYLFKNEKTGEINVVYRRKDGNYGVIIPLD